MKQDELYQKWVHQSNLPPLTNTQHKFALFLLENSDMVGKIGNLEDVFHSIRKFLRK